MSAEADDSRKAPERVVHNRQALVIGGTEFVLYPAQGDETEDALLIYLPRRGVLFVGDAFMPDLGAPFLPEGLPEGPAEGLFEIIVLSLPASALSSPTWPCFCRIVVMRGASRLKQEQ